MSKGFWRTAKLKEPFSPGKCATERVSEYVRTWQLRCYSDDIPDEVPQKVAASGRAPSWRAVAIALLQNDLHLYQLGYTRPSYEQQQRAVQLGYLAIHGSLPGMTQLNIGID
jgi:predicted phosphoadenosine phosphosulfate sulfurtransferase